MTMGRKEGNFNAFHKRRARTNPMFHYVNLQRYCVLVGNNIIVFSIILDKDKISREVYKLLFFLDCQF